MPSSCRSGGCSTARASRWGWFGFALVAAGVGALHWLAASLYYVTPMPPAPVIGQAGLSVAIYPCVAWTISRVHRLTRPDTAAAG